MPTSASELSNPLLSEDLERLAQLTGCQVDVLSARDQVGVVVCAFELPTGIYSKAKSDILLQTTVHYPASAMDMFWVDQDLLLAGGRAPVGGESIEVHFERTWRRYSWHRNAPWQPGRDDLVSHFEFALARLQRAE